MLPIVDVRKPRCCDERVMEEEDFGLWRDAG